ncbi:MAG: hypothetical protein EPN30_03310 [Actinomycetota bacterium]|nr:MAG: hypothetical protein EPN30_03310 [Actinomycetota bacterium]
MTAFNGSLAGIFYSGHGAGRAAVDSRQILRVAVPTSAMCLSSGELSPHLQRPTISHIWPSGKTELGPLNWTAISPDPENRRAIVDFLHKQYHHQS